MSLLEEDDFLAMARNLRTKMFEFGNTWTCLSFEIRAKNVNEYRQLSKTVYEAAQALEQAHRLAKLYETMESENRPEGRQDEG